MSSQENCGISVVTMASYTVKQDDGRVTERIISSLAGFTDVLP